MEIDASMGLYNPAHQEGQHRTTVQPLQKRRGGARPLFIEYVKKPPRNYKRGEKERIISLTKAIPERK